MQCISYCISVSDHNSLGKSSFKLEKYSAYDKHTAKWFFYTSAENILIADIAAEKPLLFPIVLVLLALLL